MSTYSAEEQCFPTSRYLPICAHPLLGVYLYNQSSPSPERPTRNSRIRSAPALVSCCEVGTAKNRGYVTFMKYTDLSSDSSPGRWSCAGQCQMEGEQNETRYTLAVDQTLTMTIPSPQGLWRPLPEKRDSSSRCRAGRIRCEACRPREIFRGIFLRGVINSEKAPRADIKHMLTCRARRPQFDCSP